MVDHERVDRLLSRIADADAIRRLGAEGVLHTGVATSVAGAVGFRNILVHGYADVDDRMVVENLARLDELEGFVAGVAAWMDGQP